MGRQSRRGENVVLVGLTTVAALVGGAPITGVLTADATETGISPLRLDTAVVPTSSTEARAEVTTAAQLETSGATRSPTTRSPTTPLPTTLLPAPAVSSGAALVRPAADIERR